MAWSKQTKKNYHTHSFGNAKNWIHFGLEKQFWKTVIKIGKNVMKNLRMWIVNIWLNWLYFKINKDWRQHSDLPFWVSRFSPKSKIFLRKLYFLSPYLFIQSYFFRYVIFHPAQLFFHLSKSMRGKEIEVLSQPLNKMNKGCFDTYHIITTAKSSKVEAGETSKSL